MSELPNFVLIHLHLLTQAFFSQIYQPCCIIRILGHAPKHLFNLFAATTFGKKMQRGMTAHAMPVVNPAHLLTVVQQLRDPHCTGETDGKSTHTQAEQACYVFRPNPGWWTILALRCKVPVNAEQRVVSVNMHLIREKSRLWFLLSLPLFFTEEILIALTAAALRNLIWTRSALLDHTQTQAHSDVRASGSKPVCHSSSGATEVRLGKVQNASEVLLRRMMVEVVFFAC